MAVPVKNTSVSDDSSSSDDEELKKCQEAVWEARAHKTKDEDEKVKESKRVVVADHEHDGNELQVTQGFRTHVAKKLGYFLDSCLSEMQPEISDSLESTKRDDDDNSDEGFRLFSTSIPGQKANEPPAPVRRRPVSSSSDSDSDMETRLKEAAVSLKDLLPPSALPPTFSNSSTEMHSLEKLKKKKKVVEGEESHGKTLKKKKKRKQNCDASEQLDCTGSAHNQSNGEHSSLEQQHSQVKVKKKKKRKGKPEVEV